MEKLISDIIRIPNALNTEHTNAMSFSHLAGVFVASSAQNFFHKIINLILLDFI